MTNPAELAPVAVDANPSRDHSAAVPDSDAAPDVETASKPKRDSLTLRIWNRLRRPKLTIGGLLILVALIAIAIVIWMPRTTKIVDLKIGTGKAVEVGDQVEIHYVARLDDGRVLDESRSRGAPFPYIVGQTGVISGFQTGVLGMKVGGVRIVKVPPAEAYGDSGVGSAVPPGSTLFFEIELIKIQAP